MAVARRAGRRPDVEAPAVDVASVDPAIDTPEHGVEIAFAPVAIEHEASSGLAESGACEHRPSGRSFDPEHHGPDIEFEPPPTALAFARPVANAAREVHRPPARRGLLRRRRRPVRRPGKCGEARFHQTLSVACGEVPERRPRHDVGARLGERVDVCGEEVGRYCMHPSRRVERIPIERIVGRTWRRLRHSRAGPGRRRRQRFAPVVVEDEARGGEVLEPVARRAREQIIEQVVEADDGDIDAELRFEAVRGLSERGVERVR